MLLPGIEPTDRQRVAEMPLQERIDRAVKLLRDHEPPDGYYLAFSGGKDSCVIKELAKIAGVKFEGWYNNTTIDPPELVRFIKREHPEVKWNQPKLGNMLYQIGQGPHGVAPPTRFTRWCCREWKEQGGKGRTCVFGVRAEESAARAKRWNEVAQAQHGRPAICPIVFWTDAQVWEFLKTLRIPYCSLYNEGFTRLGCVVCPLKNVKAKEADMLRWPKYAEKWRKAVTDNWLRWKDVPNTKTGAVRFQGKFPTAESFWQWWMTDKRTDVMYEDCQSMLLWTNEEEE